MIKRKKENLDYEKLNDVVSLTKKILRVLFIIIILSTILVAIYLCQELKIFTIILNVLKVASPLFIGIVIAWLLDPAVRFLNKKGVKRSIASIFVFFMFIVIVYLFFRIILPMLYNEINEFVSLLPSLFLEISNFIHETFNKLSLSGMDFSSIEENIYTAIENISLNLTTNLPGSIVGFVSSLISSIGTFLIGLVIGFYLLIDFDGVKHILEFIPKKYHEGLEKVTIKLNATFRDFVQGTLSISLIIFIISSLSFKIVGLPSPMLFGLICGITNIIPYIGPWLGGAVCTIIGFTVSPLVGIITAVICFVIQQIDAIILQPLIMSKTMKLHPVTIMIGLLVFGYFFGVLGMILATPIISAFKIILNYFDDKYDLIVKLKSTKEDDVE